MKTVYLQLSRLNPVDSSFQRPEGDGAIWSTNGDAQPRYSIIFHLYHTIHIPSKWLMAGMFIQEKSHPKLEVISTCRRKRNLVEFRLIAVGNYLYYLCNIYVTIPIYALPHTHSMTSCLDLGSSSYTEIPTYLIGIIKEYE